jgi:hypothetical protein
MTTPAGSTGGCGDLALYEVCVQGHLDSRWADRLQGLRFTHKSDGTTTLTGPLADQAALHGLLGGIRDLGIPIISIRRIATGGEETMTSEQNRTETP